MRGWRLWAAAGALGGAIIAPAAAQTLTVFAAASLKNALDETAVAYLAAGGARVSSSFASSSALAKQIEQGAPADVFISANVEWMDYLQERNAIDAGTRVDLLRNRLVLVAPKVSGVRLQIGSGMPLARALGDGRLAMGDPDHVPAGRYGRQALEKMGVWDAVAPKVARADNVRAALALVARGEAPLGIVYSTDAAAEPGVRIVGEFPPDSHAPIIYPVAITVRPASRPEAEKFLVFLRSPRARPIFERHGFSVLP